MFNNLYDKIMLLKGDIDHCTSSKAAMWASTLQSYHEVMKVINKLISSKIIKQILKKYSIFHKSSQYKTVSLVTHCHQNCKYFKEVLGGCEWV